MRLLRCKLCTSILFVLAVVLYLIPTAEAKTRRSWMYCKGILLQGRVKIVTSFPDLKVQVVDAFPDLRVQLVTAFPDRPGKWQFVSSFPNFKIQFVDAFPDLKIQFVNAFPGKP